MKKALLTASSNFSRFYVRTLFVLLFAIGASTNSKAQCVGPFQGYESVPALTSTMTSAGWVFTGSTGPTVIFASANNGSLSRSGKYYLRQGTTTTTVMPTIVTPKIQTPQTFSFWIRGSSGLPYTVEFSDDAKATWVNIPNGATSLTGGNGAFAVTTATLPGLGGATAATAMQQVIITANFPIDADGYYFRITDSRSFGTGGSVQIDDFAWTSSVATDNVIIVPQVLGTATSCNVTVPATGIYKYYDVGGNSDFYSDGQTSDVIFSPANPTDKVRITFKAFDIVTGQETFHVYNSNSTSSGEISGSPFSGTTIPLGAATPLNSFTSTFGTGEVATRFVSDATFRQVTNNGAAGYEIWVECISSFCAAPGVPTVGGITPTGATLTWTGSASVGYEIAYTTTASPPGAAGTFIAAPTVTGALTGLASNTTYYGWVRAQCGASNFSTWVSTAATFTTLCAPVGVPYTENFNGLTLIPTCTSTSGGSWGCNFTNGNLYGQSLNTFFFTKPITLAAGTVYKLSYDYSSSAFNVGLQVYVGTVNNATMLTTGTLLFNHPAATNSVTNNTLNFTSGAAGTYYIGFYFASRTNAFAQLNIDNIILDVETCIAPSAVVVASPPPTAYTGTISWTAPSIVPSGGYQYYISTSNTPPSSSSTPSGTVPAGTTVTIGSLTSGTAYYVWVRSSCGGGITSLWSSSFASFTTVTVVTTVVNMSTGNNGPGGSCSVNFFDSGGAAANYADNEDFTYTFYPGTAGSKVKAVFGSFRTEANWDGLMIYNGTSATPGNLISSGAPVGNNATTCPAGAYHGTNSPGTIVSTDATGALTFVFKTDGSVLFAGWAATLSCVTVPTITSSTHYSNLCGTLGSTPITLTGTNFTAAGGVTGVFFNGVAATSFSVVNSTTLTAVVPTSGITTGTISVANATATGYSTFIFSVNSAPPTTTGATICTGGTGFLTTSTTCGGYVNSGTTMGGSLTATAQLPILGTSVSNTPVCGFNGGVSRNYTAITFQVNVSGTYTFESSATPAFDTMGFIARAPFTPGTCSSNWVVGDDDGGAGTFSLLSANLTAGVDYILFTTSWAGTSGTLTGPFSWDVSPPSGGQIMLPGVPQMNWYVDNNPSTLSFGSGNSFNPAGATGSGLLNTNTPTAPGGIIYYGACPSNPTCRTATAFVINARPTVSFTVQPGAAACAFSNVTYTTQAGQTNYVWTIPGVLNTDYTIVSGGGTTDNTVTLQWLTTGSKTVTINYSNALGCPASAAVSSTATTVSASGLSTTVTPGTAAICANVPQVLTATSGSANFFTWATTTGSLFTDAACTIAYTPGTNFATVYFKGIANAIVTASGTVGGTGCAADTNVAVTINKAIWNGTAWSNAGVGPSNTISAEFQGNFNSNVNASPTGNLSACSVVVTSGNVLFNIGTLTVQNTVAVNGGTLTFDDALYDVSLYQPNNVTNATGVYRGGNTGNITFNRTSAQLFRYDYTYWSAPVHPQNLYAMSPASPYGLFLDYNNAWNYISSPNTTTMTPAKGYAVRAPLNYNLPSAAPPNNTPQPYVAPFSGVPNNGDIKIGLLGGSGQMNLIGNPYPSALWADAFIGANSNVNGSLYFWTHTSQSSSPYVYFPSDYAIWTLGGSVGTTAQTSGPGAANNTTPTGYIASGQAFFVQGLASGDATFTNTMRAAGNNKNFYRTVNQNQNLEKNRYWLNLLSTDGAFKQALVGYIETATMDLDRLFDAEMVESGNTISLYTKVDAKKLSIQGRALPFDSADTVPLSYKSTTAANFTLSIPEADGLFESQHVYLEDRLLNIIHDLTDSAYVFATEAGTFEERFVLRYTDQALGNENPVFNENTVVVYHNANGLFINTGNENMAKVSVFDIRGRLLASQKEVNNTLTSFTTLPTTQQVLLVKIEGESGRVVTKKVVY